MAPRRYSRPFGARLASLFFLSKSVSLVIHVSEGDHEKRTMVLQTVLDMNLFSSLVLPCTWMSQVHVSNVHE
jgi:hypothetical protein